MKFKNIKNWQITGGVLTLIIVSYFALSFAGFFSLSPVITSAFPETLFGNTLGDDVAYNLKNVRSDIGPKRSSYFVWESEEMGATNIRFVRKTYNLNADTSCVDGSEQRVNTGVAANRATPDIAVNGEDGTFVVVWSDDAPAIAVSGTDILYSVYDNDCNAVISEQVANTVTMGNQSAPKVGIDNNNNFIISWNGPCDGDGDGTADDDNGVCARGFSFDRGAVVALDATEYLVNSYTTGTQQNPDVALEPSGSGEFVVAWEGEGTEDSAGIYVQGYSSYGVPTSGGNQLVNITTAGAQQNPSVAVNKGAPVVRYVVAWEGQGSGDTTGIYARRGTGCLSAECPFSNTEISVNSSTAGSQTKPQVDMDFEGDFAITWLSDVTSDNTVMGQVFNYGGDTVDAEKTISDNATLRATELDNPGLAMGSDGYFVVAWDACMDMACENPAITDARWAAQAYEGFIYKNGTSLGSANAATRDIGGVVSGDTAIDPNTGNYVLVWGGNGQDGAGTPDDEGIWFSLFDKEGNIIDSKQNARVNTMRSGSQSRPKVDFFKDDSSFVVCYDGSGDIDGDSVADDDNAIFYRRFDATGELVDTYEVLVSDDPDSTYQNCDVAAGVDGKFVVAGEDNTGSNVFVSREGLRASSIAEIPVISDPVSRRGAAVGMNANNDFVFSWNQGDVYLLKGTHELGVDASGPVLVADVDDSESQPELTLNDEGLIVVAWPDQVGLDYDVKVRPFQLNDSGVAPSALSDEFTLNQVTAGNQTAPVLATDAANNFVATWFSDDGALPESPFGIWFQWDSEGNQFAVQGPEFYLDEAHFRTVGSNEAGPAFSPVALYEDGTLVIYVRAKDSDGFNWYGDMRQLRIGESPILTSTIEQEVLSGGRTLVLPDSIQFPAVAANAQTASTNTLALEDNEASATKYVEVQDLFADGNTYSVIISIGSSFVFDGTATDCTDNNKCIPDANIEIRNYDQDGDRVTAVAYSGNMDSLTLDNSTDSFVSLTTSRTLATGTGDTIGRWRFYPELRVTIPPNVPPGSHAAVLTFSLN